MYVIYTFLLDDEPDGTLLLNIFAPNVVIPVWLLPKNVISAVDDTVFEIVSRVDTVEKRASNMIFQQEEPECDLVIIR